MRSQRPCSGPTTFSTAHGIPVAQLHDVKKEGRVVLHLEPFCGRPQRIQKVRLMTQGLYAKEIVVSL